RWIEPFSGPVLSRHGAVAPRFRPAVASRSKVQWLTYSVLHTVHGHVGDRTITAQSWDKGREYVGVAPAHPCLFYTVRIARRALPHSSPRLHPAPPAFSV